MKKIGRSRRDPKSRFVEDSQLGEPVHHRRQVRQRPRRLPPPLPRRAAAARGTSPATDASTQSGSSTATRTSKLWTSDGRRSRRSSPRPTTEQGAEQAIIQSPLTDSNRRSPPYHGGSEAVTACMRGHSRSRNPCKSEHHA